MAKHTDLQKAIKILTKKYLQSENRTHLMERIRQRLTAYEIQHAFPFYKEYGYTLEEIENELVEYVADYLISGNADKVLTTKIKDGEIPEPVSRFELMDLGEENLPTDTGDTKP